MAALPADARYHICVDRRGGLRSVGCGGASCTARVKSRSRRQGSRPEGEKVSVDRTVEEGVERARERLIF